MNVDDITSGEDKEPVVLKYSEDHTSITSEIKVLSKI